MTSRSRDSDAEFAMPHSNILDSSRSALLIVDVQEAFRNAIGDFASVVARTATAVSGFQTLGRPVFVTEQYPKGLGRTAAEIVSVLSPGFECFEKTAFSGCGASGFVERLTASRISQIVLCGFETHVCVNQTAHDLLDLDFEVHLLTDCVASRSENDKRAGLEKMLASGVVSSSVEMALFEVMRDATHEKFKEIQRLIK